MEFIAYYRVSTDKQGISGLGLDAQRYAVAAFVQGRGTLLAEVTEIESAGKARPQLDHALQLCRNHKATLLIARLDRLARNVAFISNLLESNVAFQAVDMPEANRLTIHILAAVAEHEREIISTRTKNALAAAKARGIKLGNPHPHAASQAGIKRIKANARQFREKVRLIILHLQAQGYSLSAIARELNARKIVTARGGLWYPATVKLMLEG
ncbi:MAG: recombinase family protein [Chloroflexota bacterium]